MPTQNIMPERDPNGFLVNLNAWNHTVAEMIASEDGIILTQAHWEVINFLREFYQEYKMAPSMRTLVNALKEKMPTINSIYLHQLFPQGAALQANKIAGLPKPVRCI